VKIPVCLRAGSKSACRSPRSLASGGTGERRSDWQCLTHGILAARRRLHEAISVRRPALVGRMLHASTTPSSVFRPFAALEIAQRFLCKVNQLKGPANVVKCTLLELPLSHWPPCGTARHDVEAAQLSSRLEERIYLHNRSSSALMIASCVCSRRFSRVSATGRRASAMSCSSRALRSPSTRPAGEPA